VSGDSIAQQHRALEDFLSVQKENTEVSYFTSELTMESPDLRRTICRQLLGQKVGSFIRPLKELLKDLHEQPGPFLLCIKQAQTLPNDFLQELWDWVTESKKQSPDHHVNVILFGEKAWAEKAKKWLPKRNSNRPVLLSTQSVDPSRFDVNALESLMAEDRPKFSLSLLRRNEFSPPVVTQKWFIATILALLFTLFVGLMSWQYPSHVTSLLQTGQFPPESDLTADQLALLNQQLDAQTVQQKEQQVDVETRTGNNPLAVSEQQNSTLPTTKEDERQNSPISSWDEARQTSDSKIDALKQSIENRAQTAINVATSSEQAAVSDEDELNPLSEGDFAVPDIISIEQLDATLGNDLLSTNANQVVSNANIGLNGQDIQAAEPNEQAAVRVDGNQLPQAADLPTASIIYEFDESNILALAEPGVLLQISGIQNRTVLDEYIADNELQNSVWIYQTTRYGGPWHVVLINRRFASVAEAREASTLLPESVPANVAFAKDLAQIKLEIRNR
jgi:DamX protein